MNRIIKYCLLILVLSVSPVLVLFCIYSYRQHQASYDFTRNFKEVVKAIIPLDIKYNSYYIAGKTDNCIYLGNRTAACHLLKISSSLKDTQSVEIHVDSLNFTTKGHYKVTVDSPYVYMANGVARSILYGTTKSWKVNTNQIVAPYFNQIIPLSNQSMVFRYISNKTHNNSLRKESLGLMTIENTEMLEKQVDGLFCTDGTFKYNRKLNILTYVYFYRNEILVMDTNLVLRKRIKTIDPIDTARIDVTMIQSSQSATMSSEPLLVNARAEFFGKYIFVQSKLMGKHEDEKLFKNSTAIDVYDLEQSKYLYSFYIPSYRNQPITDFRIFDGYLIVVADHFLVKYPIQLPNF